MLHIDHILWAVPDLDQGIALFEQLTGVRPAPGGSHPGRGTRNALASFGNNQYIELLAPDPAQDLSALPPQSFGATALALPAPALFTFCVASPDMAALEASAKRLGLPFQGPNASSRLQPDCSTLHWRLGYTEGTRFGRCAPFYIDWQDSVHPSTVVPGGLSLRDFEVLHPEATELGAMFEGLGLAVTVRRADRPGLRAVLGTPAGEVVLTSLG